MHNIFRKPNLIYLPEFNSHDNNGRMTTTQHNYCIDVLTTHCRRFCTKHNCHKNSKSCKFYNKWQCI